MRSARLCWMLVGLFLLGCQRQGASEPQAGRPTRDVPAASTTPAATDGAEGVVELDAITLTPPPGWPRKPASSPFVIAEFVLPRAEGDAADGRLTISTAGGSVQANIDRWKGQFEPQPDNSSQEEVTIGSTKATIVDLSGTFNDQRGPFAPGERRPGYRMIAAVIPADGQLHFVKATGPQKTIAAHAAAIQQFIRTAQPKS